MATACGAAGTGVLAGVHACGPRHGSRCAQPRHWGRATDSEGIGEASARQGRGRVFDADVAVTYTAVGFTDAWQTAPHGRDRMQPRAWLLDTCVCPCTVRSSTNPGIFMPPSPSARPIRGSLRTSMSMRRRARSAMPFDPRRAVEHTCRRSDPLASASARRRGPAARRGRAAGGLRGAGRAQ